MVPVILPHQLVLEHLENLVVPEYPVFLVHQLRQLHQSNLVVLLHLLVQNLEHLEHQVRLEHLVHQLIP